MDIRSRLKLAFVLPVILLTGFQCSNESRLLESIPRSTYIDNCPDMLYEFGEMVSVGDPGGKFMVHLPYSWDIRESYSDSLYGVFASNFLSIPKTAEDRMAVSVSGYSSEKDLDQYVRDELVELVKADNTSVLERGMTWIAGRETPWILFEIQEGIYNMVYYIESPGTNDFFLIQTVSYDTVNYKNKMCHLKQLINSFELLRN